jgi:hypothetical protein
MKRKITKLFAAPLFLSAAMISACTEDPIERSTTLEGANTYVGFAIKYDNAQLAGSNIRTRYSNDDYNSIGTYEGRDLISTIDLYLSSPDGTFLQSQRFVAATDLTYTYADNGLQVIKAKNPIKTTAGDKIATVIINSPRPLMATQPTDDQTFAISTSLPFSSLGAFVENEGERILQTVLTGRSDVTTIAEGVGEDDVQAGANTISVEVSRLVSRVVVSKTAGMESTSKLGGTFSNTTYAVGQGALVAYIHPQIEGTEYKTWGYDYVPDGNYLSTSTQYYCYEDLLAPVAVPDNLNTDVDKMANLANYEGKLLLENTHFAGADPSISKYKKGNTAYVLISTVFTPDASMIKDGGTLTDGTFYVGDTDGDIYSSIEAATNATTGSYNQHVMTYTGGKMLYFVWINPDNITKPMNSPVLRNNIYQINISAIHKLGVNWNPLNPDVNNPDPRPAGDEPASPIVPTDPLSLDDTYMTVDIEVQNWTVHSYDLEL